ncbi:MAG TPA: hypothetical protein VLM89_17395, partial [Phycisphaerae bacterium]|nr:hypothetical protein [Phycisphaerae bacterium]
ADLYSASDVFLSANGPTGNIRCAVVAAAPRTVGGLTTQARIEIAAKRVAGIFLVGDIALTYTDHLAIEVGAGSQTNARGSARCRVSVAGPGDGQVVQVGGELALHCRMDAFWSYGGVCNQTAGDAPNLVLQGGTYHYRSPEAAGSLTIGAYAGMFSAADSRGGFQVDPASSIFEATLALNNGSGRITGGILAYGSKLPILDPGTFLAINPPAD